MNTEIEKAEGGDNMSGQALDEKAAKFLTTRIKGQLNGLKDALTALPGLMDEAWDGRAWEALNYETWPAYLAAEFGPLLASINATVRRELVPDMPGELTRGEMADVFGVDPRTIQRDVNPKPAEPTELLAKLNGNDPEVPAPRAPVSPVSPVSPPTKTAPAKPKKEPKTGPVVDEIQQLTAEYEVQLAMRENENVYTVTVTVATGEDPEGEVTEYATTSGEEPGESTTERLIDAAIKAVADQFYS